MSVPSHIPHARRQFHLIGGGLAGSILAWHLYEAGVSWRWTDEHYDRRPSDVAAGILNPITGRRYALSWRFPALLEQAHTFYRAAEKRLGCQVFRSMPLYRGIADDISYQDWDIRAAECSSYMGDVLEAETLCPSIAASQPYFGEVHQAHQLWISRFCAETWAFMRDARQQGALGAPHGVERRTVGTDELVSSSDTVIVAQGPSRSLEKLFPLAALHRTKGEVLLIRSHRAPSTQIIKDKYFLCPMWDENIFWIGSNYAHRADADTPTEEMGSRLTSFCDELLHGDYEIVEHLAAYRPTVVDRKPIVGRHPDHSHIYLCNGLGTKGASLGLLAAKALMDHLTSDVPIPDEISLSRFL